MKIEEAISTGLPFKLKNEDKWIVVRGDEPGRFFYEETPPPWDRHNSLFIHSEAYLSDNWEVNTNFKVEIESQHPITGQMLPCPFCGAPVRVGVGGADNNIYWAICQDSDCRFQTMLFKDADKLLSWWNRRHEIPIPPDSIPKRVADQNSELKAQRRHLICELRNLQGYTDRLFQRKEGFSRALEKIQEQEKPNSGNDPLGMGIVNQSYRDARQALEKFGVRDE